MNANWLAAIASLISALVVAITAIAAFVQIRHLRTTNDITVYLRLVDRLDSPAAQIAFESIDAFRERTANDPSFRLALTQRASPSEEFQEIGYLLRFFEHLSTLGITGGVSEKLVLAEYADNIADIWERLAETVYLRRLASGPHTGAAFEHLAMRAKSYLENGEMDRLYGRLRRDPRMADFQPPRL